MFHAHVHAPVSSPTHGCKRRQSQSPSPPSKRRAPPSYVPSIYSPVPTSASALPDFHRSLSLEASYGGTPASERSSPGLDWMQRTQDLQLATGGDTAMDPRPVRDLDCHRHELDEDDPHTLAYSPLPAMPISRSATSSPFPPPPPPRAPHDAPPLHYHLAGSPSMTRSSSSTSLLAGGGTTSASAIVGHSSAGQTVHPYPPPIATQAMSYESSSNHPDPDHDDVVMDSAGAPPPGASHGAAGGARGSWKVTMGYRADCEKCLARQPGHYTHIVYNS
ncbi:hypothetical protein JCM11491_006001 [Sporobolomyces phaffii]